MGNSKKDRKKATPSRKNAKDSASASKVKISRFRLWFFRLFFTIIFPILLLLILEGVLRISNFGYPIEFCVPGEVDGKKVLRENIQFNWRFFPPLLAREPDPFHFSPTKNANTFRVFVLGASAAKGVPASQYSFGRMLEVMLEERFPDLKIEVIVAATTAINSHVVLEIAKDCANYDADLFVVYLGNNEVVGPYGPGTSLGNSGLPLKVIRFGIAMRRFRVVQLFDQLTASVRQKKSLQAWRGMETFAKNRVRSDDPKMQDVYANFRANLNDICAVAKQSETDVVLCTVGANLKDCPPFASAYKKGVRQETLSTWQQILDEGRVFEADGFFGAALQKYKEAAKIDDVHAELHYRMAKCALKIGNKENARDHFIKAREQDTLRFRADTQINQAIREVAQANAGSGVQLVDVENILFSESRDGIPGESYFYEHVHLTMTGNYLVAKRVLAKVERVLSEQWNVQPAGEVPDESKVAGALAFTPWDHKEIVDHLYYDYLLFPPFTDQAYYDRYIATVKKTLAYMTQSLRNKENLMQTATTYEYAIERDPKDWMLHHHYGLFLHNGVNNKGAALQEYKLSLQYSNSYSAHMVLANFYGAIGDYKRAKEHSLQALEQKPNCGDAYYVLGAIETSEGNDESALKLYRKAVKFQPTHLMAWQEIIHTLELQGRLDKISTVYEKAIKMVDTPAALYYAYGKHLEKRGMPKQALEQYYQASDIEPNLPMLKERIEELSKTTGK